MPGKTVLITGASRGIGRAAAAAFAREGYRVAVNYHKSREAAQALAGELQSRGCDALAFQADVADRAQVGEMFAAVRRELGGVHVLVNNAGVAKQQLFGDVTSQDWDRMFGVNLKGMYHCIQEALPWMIREKRGSILNLSSIWGITGASCEAVYSATKAGVIGLTKALAKELGPSGIRVNCVAPGVIDTDMNRQLSPEDLQALREETPLEALGTPEDVAELLVFLASEKAGFITGQVISPNGGFLI